MQTLALAAASLASTLQQLLSQNKAVTIATKASATNLVPRHQYMVDRVTFDASGNASIRLRNPWGTDGPSADATNDGYVTVSAATLFNAFTRIESAAV